MLESAKILRICCTLCLMTCFSQWSNAQSSSQLDLSKSSRRQQEVIKEANLGAKQTPEIRPNIILINLDDADIDLFADEILEGYLPNIRQLAMDGLRFTNCHVVTPLCGPSRTCLLRGQHAHRTGIKTNVASGPMNNGYTGAYQEFKQRGYEQEHLGVWMQRAGYRTMMIGKYLHGRMNPIDVPGWDDLHICFGGNYYATSRYSTRFPVAERRRATAVTDYRTVVEANEAVWMIEQQAKRNHDSGINQPFFLYIAPLAPHKPAGKTPMLLDEYRELGKEIRLPDTPDFNETDVSDKPPHLQAPALSAEVVKSMHDEFRLRVLATKSVDDMVGRIRDTLKKTGADQNTFVFFTSDHGYQLGHNRMIAKKVPFHRNTVVPMFVVGPGVTPGVADHLLAHIDLVPTFLDLAGGEAPVQLDGKSWRSLFSNTHEATANQFRSELLIQNWEAKSQLGNLIPASYASLRMPHEIYTQWSNGEREYYDLASDPYQLDNRISFLSEEQTLDFSARLRALKRGSKVPVVTLVCPALISKNTLIAGVAEDDDSIVKVKVSIEDLTRNRYWTDGKWSPNEGWTEAKLANPKGLISDWHTRVDFTEIENNGSIQVLARSQNAEGKLSQPVSETYRVDAIEPTTEVRVPQSGSEVESPFIVFGVCNDNAEMHGVELELEDLDLNQFWDGSKWTKKRSTFFKRVAQERWHVELNALPGYYRVTARALDRAGNYDATPEVKEFRVK